MDTSPCIVLATSGMLNGGPVMEYFKNWAHEERILCVLLAIRQKERWEEGYRKDLGSSYGDKWPNRNCQGRMRNGDHRRFLRTLDRRQLLEFVDQLHPKPRNILSSR